MLLLLAVAGLLVVVRWNRGMTVWDRGDAAH